jgi:hypothetical protein
VDHAGCTCILAKSGIADLKKLNVPLDTYYFCQNYNFFVQFQGQIDTSAVQNVLNLSEQQNSDRRARGDDVNGHSGLSQQPSMELTMPIDDTMVLQRSASQQVSSVLIVVLSFISAL